MAQDLFRVIQGTFLVRGFQPDGDSIRFQARVPSRFDGLRGAGQVPEKAGPRQVRMEGMDAPETHYGVHGQPLGDHARDELLRQVGFTGVRLAEELVTECQPAEVPGALLTQGFDPHGRPISYVLVGPTAAGLTDGAEIAVGAELLAQSLNARMVQGGTAYPLLYTSAPEDHRAFFREAGRTARTQRLGLWPRDATADFALAGRESLLPEHGALIFPKFFRRCMDYLGAAAGGASHSLVEWLEHTPLENDRVQVRGAETSLSQLLRHQDGRVSFSGDLLDLVFIEKGPTASAAPPPSHAGPRA